MRLAWYAGASTALAAGVVLSAFHQRANFYSAMVYLFQSNLCLMILVNLLVLVYSTFVYSLQRVCFGQLRAVEVEQLYEKAWFAVTETCLAMTIFRDEIGGFFIVMFVALLTGKVWGWIGEGRIEVLEQQPPANPRLFHTRLSISLIVSLVYDLWILRYAVKTVIDQARPDMMVMFLFEFAVLFITSFHAAMRYAIYLLDMRIVQNQTSLRLQERRRAVRAEREAILQRRAAGEADDGEPLPDEEDIDEMDIEVPGWESKGQYILGLDLWTDFVKLCIYAIFFFVLLFFYGLPLHIIRDLFLTIRSFVKRLGALMKYRQAIRDMNKYADATEEDLARENTCIICREDMHVWSNNEAGGIERSRPKKLPCGHILHLGCLKSWMERQQVCPTCRRSVVIPNGAPPPRNGDAVLFRVGLNLGGDAANGGGAAAAAAGGGAPAPAPGGPPLFGAQNAAPPANGAVGLPPAAGGPNAGGANNGGPQQPPAPNNGGGNVRMFNFGPFRVGFAQGRPQDIQNIARRMGVHIPMPAGGAGENPAVAAPQAPAPNAAEPAAAPGVTGAAAASAAQRAAPFHMEMPRVPATSTLTQSLFADLRSIERRIELGAIELQMAGVEARSLRLMIAELQRIRNGQANLATATVQRPEGGRTEDASPGETAPVTQEEHQQNLQQHEQRRYLAQWQQQLQQQRQQAEELSRSSPNAAAPAPAQSTSPNPPHAPAFGFTRLPSPQATGFGQLNRPRTGTPTSARHYVADRDAHEIPAGSPELPAGLRIPAGWTLVPMQAFDRSALGAAATTSEPAEPVAPAAAAPAATQATSNASAVPVAPAAAVPASARSARPAAVAHDDADDGSDSDADVDMAQAFSKASASPDAQSSATATVADRPETALPPQRGQETQEAEDTESDDDSQPEQSSA